LRSEQAKVSKTIPHLKNKPGMVTHICNPSYSGSTGRKIVFQDNPSLAQRKA
jgi:hypothetical protein